MEFGGLCTVCYFARLDKTFLKHDNFYIFKLTQIFSFYSKIVVANVEMRKCSELLPG